MLSIAKLRVGSEAYQLTGVAQSLNAYYSGTGEAAGWWAGNGAERLGLTGEVVGDDLRAVLAGIAPGAGGLSPNGEQISPHPRRVPGFDLTFKAPKSVSTLYAVTDDPRVQGAIIEACEAALRETLGWLERDVLSVRRGTGNAKFLADLALTDPAAAQAARVRVLPGAEMTAAVFRHRTSRAGDPLLHWHTLIANQVRGGDGRWSAFVHPDLFRSARAAGELFQASVRQELTARLGLEWRPGRHVPEVDGVPDGLCDAFSKRSKEIAAYLEEFGLPDDRAGRQAAVLATRKGKAELEGERFDELWKAEAIEFGWGPEAAEALIMGLTPAAERDFDERWRLPEVSFEPDGTPYVHDRVVTAEEWVADLLRHDLCVSDSTFTKPQLVQAIARRLGDGATVATVERVAARVLASPNTLSLNPDEISGAARWSSAELVRVERRLLDAVDQRDVRLPVPGEVVEALLESRPSVGTDQADAVRIVCESTDAVRVLVGPAGTGKTYTLDTVRAVFEAAGYHVTGATPSARAGVELADGAGIDTTTLQSLQGRWDSGIDTPDSKTVLVIDEAAMASTRDLTPLVCRVVHAGGVVVVAGDHHQMPEVQAGGGFAAAVTRSRSVAHLSVNRRQRLETQQWERDALTQLRNGSVPDAVGAYRDHDRVVVVPDREQMIGEAVGRWFDARAVGLSPVLLAGTNDMVNQLNVAVRRELLARGELTGEVVGTFAGREFRVGDRVVMRKNSNLDRADGPSARAINGQVGSVIGGTHGELVLQRDNDGAQVALGEKYLARNWLDHGYALTTHRAQGGTWDLAIGVGVDGLYREAAYTQLSRARFENWLILSDPQMIEIDTELARHDHGGILLPGEEPADADEDLIERLQKSRAKLLALTRDPDADAVAALAANATVPELETRASFCRSVEQQATDTIGLDPRLLGDAVERAQHTATHVAVGQTVKAHDRHNIGTVVGIDDLAGQVHVHFVSAKGTETTQAMDWMFVEILKPSTVAERVLPGVAQTRLDHLVMNCAETLDAWRGYLADSGVHPLEARHCERARDLLIGRAVESLVADRPDWVTQLLGTRPSDPHSARVFDQALHSIAEWRGHAQTPDDTPGLGPVPADPAGVRRWRHASRRILESRTQLDTAIAGRGVDIWPRTRSRSELDARRTELDTILADAPADQRDLIGRLTDEGQLPLIDTAKVLQDALATQGTRRDWILAHWPHVVELAEITRTLHDESWGPELTPLLESLRVTSTGPLLEYVQGKERWVGVALGRLVGSNDTSVDESAQKFLQRVAVYREHWSVTGTEPLGQTPSDPDQARHYNRLIDELTDGWGGTHLPERVDISALDAGVDPYTIELETLPRQEELELDLDLDW